MYLFMGAALFAVASVYTTYAGLDSWNRPIVWARQSFSRLLDPQAWLAAYRDADVVASAQALTQKLVDLASHLATEINEVATSFVSRGQTAQQGD